MKNVLSILFIVSSILLDASPIRSSVGHRHIAMSDGEGEFSYSAKDYVQDGLVCMWDAIENVGWGLHDDTATHWTELISGTEDAIVGSIGTRYEWTDNALVSYNTGNTFTSDKTEELLEAFQNCTFTLESITSRPTAANSWQSQIFNIAQSGQPYHHGIILRYRREDNGDCASVYTGKYNSGPDFQISPIDAVHSWTATYEQGNGRFFANGIFVGNKSAVPDGSISSILVRIGASSYQFQGCYHSIRIYNRSLSDAEVEHNATVDKVRFNVP